MELDFDALIRLDAEDLAEGGIGEAHSRLLAGIRAYAPEAGPVEEHLDPGSGSYVVFFAGKEYPIYGEDLPDGEGESWGRATYAIFDIVNRQLEASSYSFFAFNGGNDLAGLFLTAAEAEAMQASLERKEEWPYLPTTENPWYGMHHQ